MKQKATPDFDTIYREHADSVFRYCRALCRHNDAEAQDVAQETFIRVYRSLEQFEGRSSMLTWLLRIARREWIRRNARERETLLLDEAELPDPVEDLAARETSRLWLEDGLNRLPEQLREAVTLVKVDGLTHREAAEVLELPQGTVQFHVRQGLIQLRRLLKDEVGVSGVTALLLVLFLQREMKAAVTAPPELGERIYANIGREYPAAGTGVPVSHGRSGGDGSATGRHRTLAVMGVLLVLLLGMFVWKQNGSKLLQPDPLQSVLRSMAQVKTAHAQSVSRSWSRSRKGDLIKSERTAEFWFKMPSSYRRSYVDEGGYALDLVVSGGRATMSSNNHPDAMSQYTFGPIPERLLAPFAYFTSDAMIARIAREARPRITVIQAELENRTVRLVTVEYRHTIYLYRWDLYVDPVTQRVLRAEFSVTPHVNPDALPPSTVTLEHIDYDVAVSDTLFRRSP